MTSNSMIIFSKKKKSTITMSEDYHIKTMFKLLIQLLTLKSQPITYTLLIDATLLRESTESFVQFLK